MKKQYIILIAIVILVGLVLLILALRSQKSNNANSKKEPKQYSTILQPQKILDEKMNFTCFNNNQVYFLSIKNNLFYSYNIIANQTNKLSDKQFSQAGNVIFSTNCNFAHIFYRDGTLQLMDFSKDKVSNLDRNIQTIVWPPNSQKIYYTYTGNNLTSISIADPDGANWKELKKFDRIIRTGVFMAADDQNNLYYQIYPPDDNVGSDLFKIDANTKKEDTLANNAGYYQFSPDRKQLIIYQYQEDKKGFYLVDSDGKDISKLDKLPNKGLVLWTSKNELIGLEDANNLFKYSLTNNLNYYKIDYSNLAISNQLADVILLSVTDNNVLYFINNNQLFRLDIK